MSDPVSGGRKTRQHGESSSAAHKSRCSLLPHPMVLLACAARRRCSLLAARRFYLLEIALLAHASSAL